MKLCPRCKLEMNEDSALNARSHKGNIEICSLCCQIEGLEALGISDRAYGLKVCQRQAQAAKYGLDKHGHPKLPKDRDEI